MSQKPINLGQDNFWSFHTQHSENFCSGENVGRSFPNRIRKFLALQDPGPLVTGTDHDPSITKQK